MPFLFDVLFPLENGTYPPIIPFYGDFIFFNQSEHHKEVALYAMCVYLTNTCVCAGIDTCYVATVKHACGVFAIVWYGYKFT